MSLVSLGLFEELINEKHQNKDPEVEKYRRCKAQRKMWGGHEVRLLFLTECGNIGKAVGNGAVTPGHPSLLLSAGAALLALALWWSLLQPPLPFSYHKMAARSAAY